MTGIFLLIAYLLTGVLITIQLRRRGQLPNQDDAEECALGMVFFWGLALPFIALAGAEWLLRRIAEEPKEDIGTALERVKRLALKEGK